MISGLKKKNDTNNYYVFIDWNRVRQKDDVGEIEEEIIVENNITLYAVYKRRPLKVSWYYDEDLIYTDYVEYSTTTSFDEAKYQLPIKEQDDVYNYTFNGWTRFKPEEGSIPTSEGYEFEVYDDLDLYAVFNPTYREFDVQWYNCGELVSSSKATYNHIAKFDGETPTKPTDDKIYIFNGWQENRQDGDVGEGIETKVTKNTQFHAVYKTKYEATIYFKNEDDSFVDTKYVPLNSSVNTTVIPKKPGSTNNVIGDTYYTFVGWHNEKYQKTPLSTLPKATNDAEYYPVFTTKLVGFDDIPLSSVINKGYVKVEEIMGENRISFNYSYIDSVKP